MGCLQAGARLVQRGLKRGIAFSAAAIWQLPDCKSCRGLWIDIGSRGWFSQFLLSSQMLLGGNRRPCFATGMSVFLNREVDNVNCFYVGIARHSTGSASPSPIALIAHNYTLA